MKRVLSIGAAVAALMFAAASAQAVEVITNGDFEDGLTGWTTYTTLNGTIGRAPAPQVTLFDVNGSGATNAIELQVGQVAPQPGVQAGGGGLTSRM